MFVKTDQENNIITYPYNLDMYRAENRNVSLPKYLNNRFLATQNVYPVYEATKPEYDEINQNIRKDLENPYLDTDGVWRYGWIITDKSAEQIQQEFEQRKTEFKTEVNQARDAAIYKNRDIAVNETTSIPVDIRKDHPDIQNISGLVQSASLKIANNDTTPFEFRGSDDETYTLTAQEIIVLGTTVADIYSSMYKRAWEYKDQLKNLTTIEEINLIVVDFEN